MLLLIIGWSSEYYIWITFGFSFSFEAVFRVKSVEFHINQNSYEEVNTRRDH